MPYLSKTIEHVVAARLSAHMCEPNQSAYKPSHSVATALVQNDIMRAKDNQNIVSMFVLELRLRVQSDHINGFTSPACPLTCGDLQGSVFGPQLFSIYKAPL